MITPALKVSNGSFVSAKTFKRPKKRRLIATVFGAQKAGKSFFSLTAPGDIYYFPMEPGLEGVVEQFIPHKDIYIGGEPSSNGTYPSYVFAKPITKEKKGSSEYLAAMQQSATPLFERFMTDWAVALRGSARTLVVDTADALFDLCKFAHVGWDKKVTASQDPYGQKSGAVKTLMRSMVGECYNFDKNVIFLAREKELWIGNEPAGLYEPSGWNGLGYEVQVVIRLTRKVFAGKPIRKAYIQDSRLDGNNTTGLEFGEHKGAIGPIDFATVASAVAGGTIEEWSR